MHNGDGHAISSHMTDTLYIPIEEVLDLAMKAGADGVDATLVKGTGTSMQVRLGKLESVEQADDYQLGLRVFAGQKSAMVSTSKLDKGSVSLLVERAMAMAKVAPDDPYARLAKDNEQAKSFPDIDCFDATELTPQTLQDMAAACEDAARDNPKISNSEGSSASQSTSEVTIATSTGFHGSYKRSSFGFSAVVLAEQDGVMERDYDYSAAVFAEDLDDPAEIGRSAAARTISRLGADKPKTGSFPVVFDRRISRSLAGHMASALNGMAIARGTSFLKDSLGEAVANSQISLIDDPLRPRSFGGRAFDGETLPVNRRALIDKGVLTGWFLDLATSEQLGMTPTGNAGRSLSGPPSPSPSNLMIANGDISVEALISDIKDGFLVTELMGSSVSLLTGDYSRGAAGFWIENGVVTHPVSEATIAGNLRDMFMQMIPADDIDMRQSMAAPSIRVDGLTVAGS